MSKSAQSPKLTKQQKKIVEANDAFLWAIHNNLKISGGNFSIQKHEYQYEWLTNKARVMSILKGAQMGATEILGILKTLHGMVHNRYKQGVLYLLPTRTDVIDFSKGRFGTIISDNPFIKSVVRDTDTANVKRILNSLLYLRGARSSGKIEGMKATSSQLKNIPTDRNIYDEKDEMAPSMIALAKERMSHSDIQEELNLSTPTIPGYGIDKDYQASDQRLWMLHCDKCGHDTCLETEFPDCLIRTNTGKVIRICMKCKNEIHPSNGKWVAQYPSLSVDHVGYWISQLNSMYVDPGKILDMFLDPPDGNITEVYNSKLGMAHVDAQNKLELRDVYACCGSEKISQDNERHGCAAGIDVGKYFHVVIGYPKENKQPHVLYVGRLSNLNDLHDLFKRFNVNTAVFDALPETRTVRDFIDNEPDVRGFLCYYQDSLKDGHRIDEIRGQISVNRTELCDESHYVIQKGSVELPRKCPEIEQFAKEMTNIAKVLQEDEFTKERKYKYKNLGADHYRHAFNYYLLASKDNFIVHQSGAAQDILTVATQKNTIQQYDPRKRFQRSGRK